jgi:trehalose 6-phosphate phosphatase
MTRRWMIPPTSDDWALFLDVDGTLIDIAPAPDAVAVSSELPELLVQLSHRFQGSVALVSGRTIADIDALFRPFRFPAAGIHGVERRDAQGAMHVSGLRPEDLEPARTELRRFVAQHPGLLLEDKGRALALHFRQAPQLADEARQIIERLLPQLPEQVHTQPGHYVLEIKSDSVTKGAAVARFMQEPPFAGRVPVFVGDDVTDRDGFAYVETVGGQAVMVGPQPQAQRGWLPNPAAVREWLQSLLA